MEENKVILDAILNIKVSHHNKNWYKENGFPNCKIGDEIIVPIQNLYPKTKNDKINDDITLILNLLDSNDYTIRDIELLTGINRESIRRIKNGLIYHDKILEINSKRETYKDGVLYVSGIIKNSDANGEGFRNTLFMSKCNGMCGNLCQNKQYWDIRSGTPKSIDNVFNEIIDDYNDITFSGGECSFQAKQLLKLAKRIKEETDKTIWMYSGFTFEELIEKKENVELLKYIDVLVDGRFNKERANINPNPLFRGSDNQKIIDVQKSLKQNKAILYDI